MTKFNYKKWVTENKHGKSLLFEQSTQPGDANNDGVVDTADQALVLSNWLQQVATGSNGDVVGALDGLVNLSDLAKVLDNMGSSTTSTNSLSNALTSTSQGGATMTDTDGDGIPDVDDLDADGDGILDSTTNVCNTWTNYSTWINQFENMPHFSSSNPNQPCTMLCKKLTTWNNKLSTVNPGKADIIARLTCKITEGETLKQTHSCSC